MSKSIAWKDLTVSVSIDAEITVSEASAGRTLLHFAWTGKPEEKPAATIRWSLPINDIEYDWFPGCGTRRALRVDGNAPMRSRISSSAPG